MRKPPCRRRYDAVSQSSVVFHQGGQARVASGVRLDVMGGFVLRVDGQDGPTLPPKTRALLTVLAFEAPRPIGRERLKEIFGKEISRDLIGRLAERDLIGTGPREPRRGAPYTFVTTDTFLAAFGIETLRDLPDPKQLAEAGLSVPE